MSKEEGEKEEAEKQEKEDSLSYVPETFGPNMLVSIAVVFSLHVCSVIIHMF